MAITDFQPLINDLMTAGMLDTVFSRDAEDLKRIGVVEPNQNGKTIGKTIKVSQDSVAENYDRNDVNPDGGDFLSVEATWDKVYSQVAFEVHGLDEAESGPDSNVAVNNLLLEAANNARTDLSALLWTNFMAQIKLDIDSSGSYSDAALSRSTYATLASYEENTDTQITLAHLRTAINNRRLLRKTGPKAGYTWLMEEQVYNAFEPLAAALHTWNTEGVSGSAYDAGYQTVGTFEQVPVTTTPGMTTGDVFLLRRQDLRFREGLPMEIEQVPSGRHSKKFVMRNGWNCRVDFPGFQGKLTLKD